MIDKDLNEMREIKMYPTMEDTLQYIKDKAEDIKVKQVLQDKIDSEPYFDLLWEPEFYDVVHVLQMGMRKYGARNWLQPDGKASSHKHRHNSLFHHLSESYTGQTADKESGLHPLLHLVCGALMLYTRQKRGIVHPEDK